MDAFLQRFYRRVSENIGDPGVSKRLTNAQKFEAFVEAEIAIWESLLRASGQESTLGRAEATITLKSGEAFYALPGNFRQFLKFERRNPVSGGAADRNIILNTLPSVPLYSTEAGVQIIEQQRGMLLQPMPVLNADENWTLVYQKGPVRLHYAQADGVGTQTLTAGTPPTDAGELIATNDYYNGSILHVYRADIGTEQTAEVIDFDANTSPPVFHLRHPWNPIPTAKSTGVWYEISPAVPNGYDAIYATDVALKLLAPRAKPRLRAALIQDRRAQWGACRSFFLSNVADRMPERMLPVDRDDVDPYD